MNFVYFCVLCFSSPIINGKVEDRNVGEGPSLTMMFEDDKHLQYLSDKLKVDAFVTRCLIDNIHCFALTLLPRLFYIFITK